MPVVPGDQPTSAADPSAPESTTADDVRKEPVRKEPVRKEPGKKVPEKRATAKKATPAARTEPARKTTPGAKATPARKAVPAKKAVKKAVPGRTPAPGIDTRTEGAGAPLVRTPERVLRLAAARMVEHPAFAPELLALAAVEVLGPRAGDWAQRLREAYPDAGADGLARLATRRFVRQAGAGGATAALAGLFAPLAELAAVLWAQANLVLHLAAAYGRDPADPDRAVDLLVLTRVHPDAESAREALTAARSVGEPDEAGWPRAVEAAWRLAAPLVAQTGGWLALRLASRLLPGAAVLAAAAGDTTAAERLAARAVAAYRQRPAPH
ncbi:hypothetical protein ACGFIR_00105 [Micromonospora sp. NPDC049051]|uniref:hypothetical protein n=1 Tax=Micromonospora sp. NPDC049051 TaxID=3364264 RepID=UPI003713BC6F